MNATHTSRFRNKNNDLSKDKKEKVNMKIPAEKVYKTLNRQDFDLNITKYWCEYRIKHPPVRRTNHVGFLYNDYYYIFGGRDINNRKMNDMYRLQLDLKDSEPEWELIDNYGDYPKPVAEHKGVLYNSSFYVFGGVNQSEEVSNTLYIYSIEDEQWTKRENDENEVPPRAGHSMSLVGNKIVIFGGFDKGIFSNKIYIYDINANSWDNNLKGENDNAILEEGGGVERQSISEINQFMPDPRINHSQTTINGTTIVIYGGVDKDGRYFDDMWTFTLMDRLWQRIEINGEIPKARQGHSAVLIDDDSNQILFFGGKTGNIFEINEFWKFDMNTKRFTLIQGTLLQREGFTQQVKPKIIIENLTNHNPYQTFYKLKKVQIKTETEEIFNKTNGFNKNKEKKNPYEDIIMGDNKARNIKNSLIYKILPEDASYINKLAENNKHLKFERFKYNEVPLPRDGHTAFMFQDKMFIFGGDRNKYPFNDIYFFDFEKQKKEEENEGDAPDKEQSSKKERNTPENEREKTSEREKNMSEKKSSRDKDKESHNSQASKTNKKSEH